MTLWVLLLMPAVLSAQNVVWDNLTCTKGVVSVSRCERATMTCSIANALTHITICLLTPGGQCLPIFNHSAPGNFSQGGWQLRMRGGSAELVTEAARAAQAGRYRWRVVGRQRSPGTTTLNVSEPPEPPFTLTPSCSVLPLLSRATADPKTERLSQTRVDRTPILVLPILCILALCALLVWYQRRRSAVFDQLQQEP